MRKRLLVALITVVIASLALGPWLFWPSSEPYYKGKRLTYWLRGYDYSLYSGWEGPKPRGLTLTSIYEAHLAVRQCGTNAIPTLCKLTEARDSEIRLKTRKRMQNSKFTDFFIQHGLLAPASPGWFRQMEGFSGLIALGTNAVGAVPTLIKMIEQSQSDDERAQAMAVLMHIGPGAKDAVPTLINVATNPLAAISGEQLVACYALSSIHAKADITVPAMIRCLQDPDTRVQLAALECVGAFGNDARPAVPALLNFIKTNGPTNRRDNDLKQGAEMALQKIAPEEAAKLPAERSLQTVR